MQTKPLFFILVIFFLAGCGGVPAPTPDAVATQIAVEEAAHATMTARAPTATYLPTDTPVPTATSTATSLPTSTQTATNSPTPYPTQTPTPTPTPTIVPVMVPAGWKTYEHFSGKFTVAYAPGWEVENESPTAVSFAVPAFALFGAGLYKTECGISLDHDPQQAQQCLAVYVASVGSSLDTFNLVGTDLWDDGVHRGYIVEAKEKDYAYDVWSYQVWIFIPMLNEPEKMMGGIYTSASLG